MSVKIVMTVISPNIVIRKICQKLGGHCSDAPAGIPGFESVHRYRFVYNSKFVDNRLFDIPYIQKLVAL